VQDTFVKIWKKVDQFDGRSALTTWIYTITFNLCLDRTRAIRRRKEITFGENFIPEMADNSEDPGIPDDESFIAAVRSLSFKMSKIQRLVFILRDIQDQPVDEVCRITGLDPDRIKANLYHARKFMREKLVKGGYV